MKERSAIQAKSLKGKGETEAALAACSDRDLFLRYRDEDELEAFQELYWRLDPRVRQFLHARRVRPLERVEDLAQAVWLKVHRARGQYDPRYEPLQWLFVITRTLWLDDLRGRSSDRDVSASEAVSPASEASPETNYLEKEDQREVLHTLASSNAQSARSQAEVFRLRVFEEKDYAEIAKLLRLKEPYVRQLFKRSRDWIRQQWGGSLEDKRGGGV